VCGVEQGENSFPSEETILQSLLADARNGKASAQWEIGKRYREGDGFPQSYEKAALWFRKAAEQGFAHAQNNLGICYLTGEGVTKNDVCAARWFRKAGDNGSVGAQRNLGNCYIEGKGVPQSDVEAFKWHRKAAENHSTYCKQIVLDQGDFASLFNLGGMYYAGRGVTKSYEEAFRWWLEAAKWRFANAQFWLGLMYSKGQCVAESDYVEAAKWFRKAADQGHANAQYMLGLAYEGGVGLAKSDADAKHWLKRAENQGISDASRGGMQDQSNDESDSSEDNENTSGSASEDHPVEKRTRRGGKKKKPNMEKKPGGDGNARTAGGEGDVVAGCVLLLPYGGDIKAASIAQDKEAVKRIMLHNKTMRDLQQQARPGDDAATTATAAGDEGCFNMPGDEVGRAPVSDGRENSGPSEGMAAVAGFGAMHI